MNTDDLATDNVALNIIDSMDLSTFERYTDGTFSFDVKDPKTMALAYEEMGQALDKLDAVGGFNKSGVY
jgi:hypothetical protein